MRRILPLLLTLFPALASACDRPVCIIDPTALQFGRIITFDDQPGNFGPGLPIEGLLVLPGASFGERFAGQNLTAEGDFDRVIGAGLPPLTLIPGAPGQTFSILRITGASLLSGTGPGGFPMNVANGEGAVAILFDGDQSVLRLDLRGGEGGVAHIMFLSRDGAVLDQIDIAPLTEGAFGFARNAPIADIAGLVISNHDPEGIALDAVAFDGGEQTSWAEIALPPSGSG